MVSDGNKRYFFKSLNIVNIHMPTYVIEYAEHKYHV